MSKSLHLPDSPVAPCQVVGGSNNRLCISLHFAMPTQAHTLRMWEPIAKCKVLNRCWLLRIYDLNYKDTVSEKLLLANTNW